MKSLPLFLAATLIVPAYAQEAPSSGYDALVAAGKLILPGENGGASAAELNLKPAENLRRERVAVARNAPALKAVREALLLPIEVPLSVNYATPGFINYGKFRELARQLSQEADVRAADGDYFGAVNSRLDAMEMGVGLSRGPVMPMLVGAAMQAIGFNKIDAFASHLDEVQCLAVLERLKRIDVKRPSLSEILNFESAESKNLSVDLLNQVQEQASSKKEKESGMSAKEIRQYRELKPEIFTANNDRLYKFASETAALPYQKAKEVKWPRDLDVLNTMSMGILEGNNLRFNYERSILQSRLLEGALLLRLEKLKTGAYPATFNGPADPFSVDGKPLVYKLEGEKYKLYSVGPDGKDDNGKAAIWVLKYFDGDTGLLVEKRRPGSYNATSKGDVLAPQI